MLTPCHFRITSCLDIQAQKTELFHAFENSLFPSNSNMRGNHYFFSIYKSTTYIWLYWQFSKLLTTWFCFLGLQNCCDPCMNICISKSIGKGEEKWIIALASRWGSWKIRKHPHKGPLRRHRCPLRQKANFDSHIKFCFKTRNWFSRLKQCEILNCYLS